MTRAKISEYSATANDNTDVNGINIAEGCPPSSMNNMGREIMAALKRFQVGSDGDGVTVGGNLIVSGTVTAANTATLGNVTSAAFAAGSAGSPTIHAAGDTNTGIFFPAADTVALATNGVERAKVGNSETVFNDGGANVDFRVEGDTEANLLFVDASADAVGIGTSSPSNFGAAVKLSIFGTTFPEINFSDSTTPSAAAAPRIAGGGAELRFSTNNAERMRITSDGYLRMASGTGGIQFNADTAAANALDDYEEGTWTPALLSGTTTTYTTQSATYTKVGRQVFVRAQLVINLVGNGNTTRITGLPFTAASVPNPGTFAVGYFSSLANNKIFVTGAVRNAEANADFFSLAAAAADNGDTAIFGNSTRIDFAGCYQV